MKNSALGAEERHISCLGTGTSGDWVVVVVMEGALVIGFLVKVEGVIVVVVVVEGFIVGVSEVEGAGGIMEVAMLVGLV